MKENKILEKAIETWGEDMQVLMLIEEMSELTKALIKYFRNPSTENFHQIAEETADVEITLAQLDIIFKKQHFNEFVMDFKDAKLQRLEQRIKDAQNENQ